MSHDYSKYIVSSHMFDFEWFPPRERLKFSYFHNNNLSSFLIEQKFFIQ